MSYGRYLDVIEAKRLVVLGADDQVVQMQQTYTIPAIVTAPEQQEAPQACMGGHQNYGNALSQVMQPSVPPTQGGENQSKTFEIKGKINSWGFFRFQPLNRPPSRRVGGARTHCDWWTLVRRSPGPSCNR